jgi:predicted nucleic-acid-binding protein
MRAIDTNVLVRLITGDDAGQAARAEKFVQKGAWVPYLALIEATWVLTAAYDKKAA